MPNTTVENVLPKLLEWSDQGQAVCLATLYHADKTSPRPIGSQMAVSEDGQWFGYLSGGCAEQAIADEAVVAIREGKNRSVRYGVGSPYLDIQLPCGAGIDVCFDQSIDSELIKSVLEGQQQRQVVGLQTALRGNAPSRLLAPSDNALLKTYFQRWYVPPRRLTIIGAGPSVCALTALAIQADYQCQVFTPDQQTLDEVLRMTDSAELLQTQAQIERVHYDAWTAVVLMFHEHERETAILRHVLNTNAYYVGALGSRLSQQIRMDSLRNEGVAEVDLKRIHGPVGLNIQARTPAEIAVSILAQLTQEYQAIAPGLLDYQAD